MTNNLKNVFAFMLGVSAMSPDDGYCGYGGIDMCIRCKEKGADKFIGYDGKEKSACECCPNNITNVYKEM